MTNEEAIGALNHLRCAIRNGIPPTKPGKAIEGVDLAISALERDRWISVEERLPEGHEYVLCCGSKGGQFVGWVAQSVRGKKAYAFQHGGNGRRITHWRPLPEPPKEEKP